MKNVIAMYTLSDHNKVYISKDKEYEVHVDENGEQYIYDNDGKKMIFTSAELKERFQKTS